MARLDSAAVTAALDAFFPGDREIELRAIWPGRSKVVRSADRRKLVSWVEGRDKERATGTYAVMNRFGDIEGKGVRDEEVVSRDWLLVDIDSVREKGISATDAELACAVKVLKEIRTYLTKRGWPQPFSALSGNGCHLMWRVNLDTSEESTELVKRFLDALSWKFDEDGATIDKTVFNLSRIWRLPGTVARKGEESKERPWRRAELRGMGEGTVERAQIEALVKKFNIGKAHDEDTAELAKLRTWLHSNWPELGEPSDYLGGAGRRWVFPCCPWDPEHTDKSAYVIRFRSGAVTAGCLHQTCEGATRNDVGKSLGWRRLQKLAKTPFKIPVVALLGASTAASPGLTDLGNAKRLARQHAHDLRYAPFTGRWMTWDGMRWADDQTGAVMRMAADTVSSIFAQAQAEPDEDRAKALRKWGKASESAQHLSSMVNLARHEEGITTPADMFDSDDWALNVQNGMLDLRAGMLSPHRRDANITKVAPVEYGKEDCPKWKKFMSEVFEDQEMIDFVQRAVGYSITGNVSEQVLFFCHGTGANGKTTFMRTVQHILGDYATQTDPSLLMASAGFDAHPTGYTDLFKIRFAGASETERGRHLAESMVKQLTGDDVIVARRMRQDFIRFLPTHKLWITANYKPIIKGNDVGIWRRIVTIPFEKEIPASERDKRLLAALREEAAGILAWAVEGCMAWQKEGLSPPEGARLDIESYQDEMDMLKEFFEDCCTVDARGVVTKRALYDRYLDWCEVTHEKPVTPRLFARMMRERRFKETVAKRLQDDGTRYSVRFWKGLKIGKQSGNVVEVDFG